MLHNTDELLRLVAAALLTIRYLFWITREIIDNRKTKKSSQTKLIHILQKMCLGGLGIFLYIQLFGYHFLSYLNHPYLEFLGFVTIVIAHVILFKARYDLADNWTHAVEYQIKINQKLVTHGIYGFIRHPIYLGVILTFLGVELLVGSYLFFVFLIVLPPYAYIQAKKEESILASQFKDIFREYQKNSSMFIPYIF